MAKYIESIETNKVKLEVIQCECSFNFGLDAEYLEKSRDYIGSCMIIDCPCCGRKIETKHIPEVAVGLDAIESTKLPLRLN